jgi:hypothetical protein
MDRLIRWTRSTFAKVYNLETRKAWIATTLSMALFTVLFWLMVAAQLGRLEPRVEESGEGFPTIVVIMYFCVSLVGAPVIVHTAGYLVERRTEKWKRDDAVIAFAGLGLVLAVPPVALLTASEPEGAALRPAIWLFGIPVMLATVFTRFFIDEVLRSQRFMRTVAAVALLPPVVVLLFLLGLYVAQGSEAVV